MTERERILPIGSIVITKEGNIPLMIVSRGALFEQNGELGYFDYSAIPYPMGMTEEQDFAFFNREDIENIIYFGYVNSDEQIFAENYDDLLASSGYEKLSLK